MASARFDPVVLGHRRSKSRPRVAERRTTSRVLAPGAKLSKHGLDDRVLRLHEAVGIEHQVPETLEIICSLSTFRAVHKPYLPAIRFKTKWKNQKLKNARKPGCRASAYQNSMGSCAPPPYVALRLRWAPRNPAPGQHQCDETRRPVRTRGCWSVQAAYASSRSISTGPLDLTAARSSAPCRCA